MEKSQHTPYFVNKAVNIPPTGLWEAIIDAAESNAPCAFGCGYGWSAEEAEANAHLIASALFASSEVG